MNKRSKNQCEDVRSRAAFYLDDELSGSDLAAFEAHLESCASCKGTVSSERRFIESVREAKPLAVAPPELRTRVEKILNNAAPAYAAPPELRRRVRESLFAAASPFNLSSRRRRVALTAIAVFIIALPIAWYSTRLRNSFESRPPSAFAMMAVDTHLRHLRGQLPFEITSEFPEEISRWFEGKVPFSFKLPKYQEESGQEKLYRLEGARLVGFKSDYAAFVAYRMQERPISLVVTSAQVAVPSGGEQIISKGLTFHYDWIDGLKVITWSDRGLTYALVSNLEERGQQSCMVCHAGTKDRDFIESFKPAR
ncbi:MAG TPA: zf-HC2 domain-containing protein [Blastocatellia bacterium]|nr:zf-HC2 domain-containing protein [Blastocatellia bacterium]